MFHAILKQCTPLWCYSGCTVAHSPAAHAVGTSPQPGSLLESTIRAAACLQSHTCTSHTLYFGPAAARPAALPSTSLAPATTPCTCTSPTGWAVAARSSRPSALLVVMSSSSSSSVSNVAADESALVYGVLKPRDRPPCSLCSPSPVSRSGCFFKHV